MKGCKEGRGLRFLVAGLIVACLACALAVTGAPALESPQSPPDTEVAIGGRVWRFVSGTHRRDRRSQRAADGRAVFPRLLRGC